MVFQNRPVNCAKEPFFVNLEFVLLSISDRGACWSLALGLRGPAVFLSH
jgi:hypothetical protein